MRTEQNRTEQNRDNRIDIAKGIGMTLVIFGHLSERTQVLRILTYSFHMPLFFLISGFLLNTKRPLKQSIKKDFSKLIIPAYEALMFDSIICILKYCVIGEVAKPLAFDWVKGILLYGGVLWNSPVWFLLTLFSCKYIFVCCGHLHKSIPYIITLLCVGACCVDFNGMLPSWWPFNVIMAFPFFTVGVLVKCIEKEKRNAAKLWVIIPLTVLWMFLSLYNGYTDIHIQINGKNYLLFIVTGIVGSYLCIALSTAISKTCWNRLLECIGQHSFVVLITHYYICRGLIPVTFKNLGIESNIGIQCMVTFLIALVYYGIIKMHMQFRAMKTDII